MKLDEAFDVIETENLSPFEVCELLDRRRIIRALNLFGWNQLDTADYLKLHRNTLGRRMVELGIEKPEEIRRKHRVGRPRSLAGEFAKQNAMITRTAKRNGLDREISPLVARIRLRQHETSGAYRAAAERRKKANASANGKKIERMFDLMAIMEQEKKAHRA